MEFFVTAGGIPVHILDTRNGNKTLLLLHGYLETMCIWTDFIDLLSKKYRVITIDLPGHGLTGTAPKSNDSSPSVNSMEFCAGVIKDIMDICGITSAYIGGHSLGGYIALACCRLYPDRFDKLILFNLLFTALIKASPNLVILPLITMISGSKRLTILLMP